MGDKLVRKCAKCKGEIVVDIDDIKDVVYFKKLYYHLSCFKEAATEKSHNKRCSPDWKEALNDNFRRAIQEAQDTLIYCYGRDKLYNHILDNYDVLAVSRYLEMQMHNVVVGQYKGRSKPISYIELANCWVSVQSELDQIYSNNKKIGKNMAGDQRINYDLAVVVGMYPKWKKTQDIIKTKAANRKVEEQNVIKIDYTQIKTLEAEDGLGDINDLLDEI